MSALANLKTTYERTKSKLLSNKEGDAEDKEYFDEKEKVLLFEQVLVRLNKREKKSLELYAELSKVQNEIAQDLSSMYSSDDRMHTTVALIKEAASSGEVNRQKMNERMEKNLLRPVDEYCASFREMKKRTDEYTIRRSEMERLRLELSKLQEKGAASAPKVPMAEEKYKAALQKYEEMREELLVDLPALNNDRNAILGFMLASSLKSQATYYADLAEKYSVVNSLVSNIDEKSVLNHGHVITPHDKSAAAQSLRAHPVFIKGDAQKNQQMQPVKSPAQPQPQLQPSQPLQNTQPQPLIQPTYTLQKQPTPTTTAQPPAQTQPTQDVYNAAVYNAEVSSITMAPAATPLAAALSPQFQPVKAQGLYDFNATEDNELSFKKGDIITIIAKQHGDWWEGELNGVAGLLPSNYVKEI